MTRAGRVVVATGVLLIGAGVLLGYPPVLAVGVTFVVAPLIGLAIARRPTRLTVDRVVEPERVTAGEPARSVLTVTNTGRRSLSAGTIRERIGNRTAAVSLPSLDAGESATVSRALPTDKRGVFAVGPLTVRRGDPLGLVRHGDDQSDTGRLIVHPATHLVSPFPAGAARDLDGIPSGEAIEGGITFSGLREYVPGDDLRLVHWRSSARLGELMVRHNVDVNRPRTAVVLDTSAAVLDPVSFEDAIRVAASIVSAVMLRRFPYTLRTTCGRIVDDRMPRVAVFDAFAELSHDPTGANRPLHEVAYEAARTPGYSCAVVTGRAGVDELRGLGPMRSRFSELTIVRVGTQSAGEVHQLVGAELINARTSADFARAWNRRGGH